MPVVKQMVYPCMNFDPGTQKNLGWCASDLEGYLLQAGIAAPKNIGWCVPGAEFKICVERPVIYPGSKQQARPADIINLAMVGGQAVGMSYAFGGCTAIVRYLRPSEWKGQVPDYELYERIMDTLLPRELAIIDVAKMANGVVNNMLDAIGVMLYANNRL